jgi:hypothetical protein
MSVHHIIPHHVQTEVEIENPLWDCDPPGATAVGVDTNLDVLRQATEIKQTLKRIETEDPLARSHHFAFRIYPENLAVLHKKGFKTAWQDPYTVVTWTRRAQAAAAGLRVSVV